MSGIDSVGNWSILGAGILAVQDERLAQKVGSVQQHHGYRTLECPLRFQLSYRVSRASERLERSIAAIGIRSRQRARPRVATGSGDVEILPVLRRWTALGRFDCLQSDRRQCFQHQAKQQGPMNARMRTHGAISSGCPNTLAPFGEEAEAAGERGPQPPDLQFFVSATFVRRTVLISRGRDSVLGGTSRSQQTRPVESWRIGVSIVASDFGSVIPGYQNSPKRFVPKRQNGLARGVVVQRFFRWTESH